jgi:hypothetical protein
MRFGRFALARKKTLEEKAASEGAGVSGRTVFWFLRRDAERGLSFCGEPCVWVPQFLGANRDASMLGC